MSSSISVTFSVVALLLSCTCQAQPVGSASVALVTPVGSYTPSNDVTNEVRISESAFKINELLTASNFDGANIEYKNSAYLMALGKGENLTGEIFNLFTNYFEVSTFNDDYVAAAFKNSVVGAKYEMVQKTTMDAIPVQAIFSFAIKGASGGDKASWDKAAALYIGLRDREVSPYDRAIKRALNFGTTVPTSGKNDAVANQEILKAFQVPSVANYQIILKNLKIIYGQCAVRYAKILDDDIKDKIPTEEHRAEGQAFYRIVAPFVKQSDSSCDKFMTDLYDLEGTLSLTGGYYCKTLKCLPAALGISPAELGTLEETQGICDANTGLSAPPASKPPASSAKVVTESLVAIMLAIFVAAVIV